MATTFNPYSITLDDIYRDAAMLAIGQAEPSVKFALWIATCSTNQSLERNGKMARMLAPYVHRPLPHREALIALLRTCKCFFTGRMIDTLYYVESLDERGYLKGLDHIPASYEAQIQWREDVLRLLRGHGMAYKTISFACLLLAPFKCELVPVDRHVLARLELKIHSAPDKSEKYQAIERIIMQERFEYGMEQVPLCLFHWWLWEAWRQHTGVSQATNGKVESHVPLSCYDYPAVA